MTIATSIQTATAKNTTPGAGDRAALEICVGDPPPEVKTSPGPNCADEERGHEPDMLTEPPAEGTAHGRPHKAEKSRYLEISSSRCSVSSNTNSVA